MQVNTGSVTVTGTATVTVTGVESTVETGQLIAQGWSEVDSRHRRHVDGSIGYKLWHQHTARRLA